MFGKPISEYLRFQKVFLVLIAVVGLARLTLSLAGLPNRTVTFVSMNVVFWIAVVYYGIAVYRSGFGSYRHLLPLVAIQIAVFQVIAVTGILLSIAGFTNIFSAPEYSGPAFARSTSQWSHAFAHFTVGVLLRVLMGWALGSLVMWVTKALTPGPLAQREERS